MEGNDDMETITWRVRMIFYGGNLLRFCNVHGEMGMGRFGRDLLYVVLRLKMQQEIGYGEETPKNSTSIRAMDGIKRGAAR
jgi:hypothetical protein